MFIYVNIFLSWLRGFFKNLKFFVIYAIFVINSANITISYNSTFQYKCVSLITYNLEKISKNDSMYMTSGFSDKFNQVC